MLVSRHDGVLFYKLHRSLMFFVNQRLKVRADDIASPEEFAALPAGELLKVRDAFLNHLDLLQAFIDENPVHLPDDELDIVRTVGWVNFLHDQTQTPHMRLSDVDAGFGVSESSGAAKLAAIRTMLRIHRLDPNWSLPSRLEDNPLVWMLEVNGFMMDVRHAPREDQEIAFNKGLIPYIPADRRQGE
jgi:hypothetical protein